jgi:hypothetical protein
LTVLTLNNPYGYLPVRCAALPRWHSLYLPVTEHLPDAVGRELEGSCGLFDGVEVLSLHGGSIHPEMPPTPRHGRVAPFSSSYCGRRVHRYDLRYFAWRSGGLMRNRTTSTYRSQSTKQTGAAARLVPILRPS